MRIFCMLGKRESIWHYFEYHISIYNNNFSWNEYKIDYDEYKDQLEEEQQEEIGETTAIMTN